MPISKVMKWMNLSEKHKETRQINVILSRAHAIFINFLFFGIALAAAIQMEWEPLWFHAFNVPLSVSLSPRHF